MAVFTSVKNSLMHAWNAFLNTDENKAKRSYDGGMTYGSRPDRIRVLVSNERSLISSIYTRISVDSASVEIRHVDTDDEGRYVGDRNSGLQECLTLEANIDQAARAFRQDMVWTMLNEGCIAVVPVDTDLNPDMTGGFDIKTLRVGRIVSWMPQQVKVDLYNEITGRREEVTLSKKFVAIVENPLYSVMNEPNSTLQRVIRKLSLLDSVDEAASSGKLDMVIQLPYVIKSESRRATAEQRRTDIEYQLKGSKYGIAYIDGTEKITQLNRPVDNNLLGNIKYLMDMLYGQLGLTPEVMNGTADQTAMLNYNNRTIEPIVEAIVEAMKRSFLTKTARTQKQSIMSFRNPFKLVPITEMADIADKMARNEILSSNEIRQAIGFIPSKNPKADELRNSNMPQEAAVVNPNSDPNVDPNAQVDDGSDAAMQSAFDDVNSTIDEIMSELENAGAG